MKRISFIMAIVMIAMTVLSGGAMATGMPYFDVLDGQKIMIGDINDIVNYCGTFNNQQLLDMGIIDRGHGMYYARVLPGDLICTWTNGMEISAYELGERLDEYKVLQNSMLLVQDDKGEVQPGIWTIGTLDNVNYPEMVYSSADTALIEQYTLAESYEDADVWDTFSIEKGFRKQELLKAFVLASRFSVRHQEWVYFWAWKVVKKTTMVISAPATEATGSHRDAHKPYVSPTPAPTNKPTEKPTNKPTGTPAHSTPRPTATPRPADESTSTEPAHSTPRPTATPRVSKEEDQFEHSTNKPSNPTQAPAATIAPKPTDHSQADEDYTASHSVAKPSKDEGVIQRDSQDQEDYTASHSVAKPSSDQGVIKRDSEDEAAASHSASKNNNDGSSHKSDATAVIVRDKDDSSSSGSDSKPVKRDNDDNNSHSSSNSGGSEIISRDSSDSSGHSSSSSHSDSDSGSHSSSSQNDSHESSSAIPTVSNESSDFE